MQLAIRCQVRVMADSCCCAPPPHGLDPNRGNAAYRRILWTVLAINLAMFLIEIGAGLAAGSASLQADALDFFGDAANYAISLMVVGMALRRPLARAVHHAGHRARAWHEVRCVPGSVGVLVGEVAQHHTTTVTRSAARVMPV